MERRDGTEMRRDGTAAVPRETSDGAGVRRDGVMARRGKVTR
jgi:hypothetical protein